MLLRGPLRFRLSITSRCNYSCVFCHREGQPRGAEHALAAEDCGFIASSLSKVGAVHYKLTGGEPLMRDDVDAVVARIVRAGGSVSLVTNGYLLHDWAGRLAAAGLSRVNVSVHSADPARYSAVTGAPPDALKRALEGIAKCAELGLGVKINAVALRGVNTDRESVKGLVRLASRAGAALQFIELMLVGLGSRAFDELHEPVETVVAALSELGARPLRLREDLHNRPVYELGGVKIEIVKGYANPVFCSACSTLRLTCDGKLLPCLYGGAGIDVLPYIKGRDAEGLTRAVAAALNLKGRGGKLLSVPGLRPAGEVPHSKAQAPQGKQDH
jgi:cyclic pyranopterin phosphate synthase